MASFLVRHGWALALVLLLGCSQTAGSQVSDEADASVDASSAEEVSPTLAEARALVAKLDARLAAVEKAELPPSGLPFDPSPAAMKRPFSPIRLVREGAWLRARADVVNPHAEVALPVDARGAFRIADKQTGLDVEVVLQGASEADAEIADGHVVYRRGAPFAGDVVHRPSAEGTEDFVLFDEAPPREELDYEVALGERVGGLRLVENVLELLDEGGAPRLRVAPPYVIGADDERHDAKLSVFGCAFDTNPAAPWGRELVPPGASRCTVRVSWDGRGVSYPAVVDPSWTIARSMSAARYLHTATLLGTGRVLVAGGSNGGYLATAELYDPETNTWSATASMTFARHAHTATLLDSGKVFIAGGYNGSTIASGNIYDPGSGVWSLSLDSMSTGRYLHVAALLEDGSVLIAGGYGTASLNTAHLYLPATNRFATTGSMTVARHYAKALTLPNRKVLVAGGVSSSTYLSSADLYDPDTKAFSATPAFSGPRSYHSMTLLPSGKVLVYGGFNASISLGSAVLYDGSTNTWSPSQEQGFTQHAHSATLLLDGKVLIAGGHSGAYLNRALFYDPALNGSSATVSMQTSRAYHEATQLPSGSVLLTGGYSSSYLATAEIFRAPIVCTQASDCESGFCADGYCCNSACDGGCGQCDRASSEGLCQPRGSGSAGTPSCSPYVCNGTSVSCPTSCTSNTQCASDHFCSGNQCVAKLSLGSACSSPAQCQSGSCSDGVCCDAACSGACDVCSTSLGASTNGTCTNLPASATCNTNYLCSGTSGACPTSCVTDANCATTAYCNASKQCVPKLANNGACTEANQCTSGHCIDGRCCNNECTGACNRCDVSGSLGICTAVTAGNAGTPSCSPYVCSGTSVDCPSSCTAHTQCATGHYCEGGSCIPKRAKGATCNAASECQSGFCTDGFCCDKACTGSCEKCAILLGASSNGTCTSLAAGTLNCGNYVCNGASGACPTSCASDANCAAGSYCNASKQCVKKLALGTSCSANNQCESENCVDNVCCNNACAGGCNRCDMAASKGTCTTVSAGTVGANPSCGQYLCDGGSANCPTTCASDANCVSTAACVGGICVAKAPLGAFCAESRLCLSGFCSDGVCCNAACDGGSCDRCDLPGSVGTCRIAPLGSGGSPSLCVPYVCNGASASCPSSCTGDSNCAVGYLCIGGTCQTKKPNGASCDASRECESGACTEGICCNEACAGACERCDLAGSKGICKPVPAKTDSQACGLYLCDGKSTGCPSSCAEDQDCHDGYCHAGRCYGKSENAAACSTGAECKSGFCVDNTCCNEACDGQCARCDAMGALGQCQAVMGDPVGGRPACGSDGSMCAGSCDGANMAACSYPTTATVCRAASCEDGVMSEEARCDGLGACDVKREPCAPYACGGTACMTGCESSADCSASAECVKGECQGTLDDGEKCVAAGECKSGFCVDGVCCQSACAEACAMCNVPGSEGSCVPNAEPQCEGGAVDVPWELQADESGPCGCRVAGEKRDGRGYFAWAGVAAVLAMMRRRRAASVR